MKFLCFFILILLMAFPNQSYPQWYQQSINTVEDLYDIEFVDIHTGWTCGTNGVIFKTSNGGSTWIQQLDVPNYFNSFYGIDFTDLTVGYAVGDDWFVGAYISKTTNAGDTWIRDNGVPQDADRLFDVFRFDSFGSTIAVGQSGTIIANQDGEEPWFLIESGTNEQLTGVSFIDTDDGWAVGSNGTILNGGPWGGWHQQNSGVTNHLFGVFAIDQSNVWVVGFDGTILHSSNGGMAWNTQVSNTTAGLRNVFFINEETGWVVGNSGTILNTTNSGETWTTQEINTEEDLLGIHFHDSQYGYVVGKKGVVFTTTNGGVTSIDDVDYPNTFILNQNYPNPFNPSTKIKFSIPQLSNVTMKVFDILGNEIEKLVDEEKPAGNYDVEFDGNGLSSGIYFYQLKSDTKLQTKKMILLR